ncbi:protein CREG2 [Gastrophryne carolinensis]
MSVSIFTHRRAAHASWLLCMLGCSLATYSQAYVIVNSVSWSVTNEVEEELDSSSTEDTLPALMEDTISLWKQSYPASAYKDADMKSRPGPEVTDRISSPSRMFSYKRESSTMTESTLPPAAAFQRSLAANARTLAHKSKWGVLATISTQEMIEGVPFGQVLLTSDGPLDNSTGVPYFFVTTKASFLSDLMKSPVASFTFSDLEGDICRRGLTDLQEPQCAALTLVGQMLIVPPEGEELAKKALFSRHPDMQKWSQDYDCLLMKMLIEHIYVTDCYKGVYTLSLEDYYTASPN